MAATMRPAANVYSNTDYRRMTCRIFYVHAHNGIFAAQALRTKADFIDAILQQLLQKCSVLVRAMAANRTHQRFLCMQSSYFYRSADANAYQKRRAGIQAIGCHNVQHESGYAFLTGTGHQHHCFTGQAAAAASHIGVQI